MKKFIKILTASLLMVMTVLVMTACVPNNPEKAAKKLEKAGYTVEVVDLVAEGVDGEGALYQVVAMKRDETSEASDGIYVIYFDSKDNAKAWYDEYLDDINDPDEGMSAKYKGKIVYWGTAQAIKDLE